MWPALAAFGLIALVGAGRGPGGRRRPDRLGVAGHRLVGTYVVPYLLGVLRRRLLQQRKQTRLSVEAQARMRERARIARDMHDSLGHELALIAVRAAGLELAPGLTPAQVRAAGEVRAAAAEATERLRQIIGLLREESDAAPLSPVDEDVADIVARARDSGMAITLDLAPGPVPDLASPVVQEALTNAAKHAPAPPSRSRSDRTGSSSATVRRARSTARSGGLGLAGLQERVRLSGGTLSAVPQADGFLLEVTIPEDSLTGSGVGHVQPPQDPLEGEDRERDRRDR